MLQNSLEKITNYWCELKNISGLFWELGWAYLTISFCIGKDCSEVLVQIKSQKVTNDKQLFFNKRSAWKSTQIKMLKSKK